MAASGQFGRKLRGDWPQSLRIARKKLAGLPGAGATSTSAVLLSLLLAICLSGPSALRAQTDCLSCHADKTMQDAAGHSVGVDADVFHASIHGSLGCTDCHTSIKEYPHPDTAGCGEVRRLPRRSGNGNRGQRSCVGQRASLHQLSWRRALHLPQGRCAVRGVSAEHSAHLRHMPRRPGAGKEVRPAECLFGVHGLHSWLCRQQGGVAGGGKLHELPRIAPHPEPQRPAEPHLQDKHSQHLRNVSRGSGGGVLRGRAWQGRRRRGPERAGMLGLPHGARHPAADAGGLPHAVHAHLRLVPQGEVRHLPGHLPLATGAAGRLCADGALLGLPWSARASCPRPILLRR